MLCVTVKLADTRKFREKFCQTLNVAWLNPVLSFIVALGCLRVFFFIKWICSGILFKFFLTLCLKVGYAYTASVHIGLNCRSLMFSSSAGCSLARSNDWALLISAAIYIETKFVILQGFILFYTANRKARNSCRLGYFRTQKMWTLPISRVKKLHLIKW